MENHGNNRKAIDLTLYKPKQGSKGFLRGESNEIH
jgi:hypothetical protein